MVISSNTLFHFTDNIDCLVSILRHEFFPQVSLENHGDLFNPPSGEFEIGVPLVSFCDLPLSQIAEHLKFYGNYGIGLRKQWGMEKGINPVMYLHSRSSFEATLDKLILSVLRDKDEEKKQLAMSIISFIKIYRGRIYRRGAYSVEKTFYDEKEWRFVPYPFVTGDKNNKTLLVKKDFFDPIKLGKINEILKNKFKLSFEPEDIRYIIVERDEEILPMVKRIEEIKGPKYSYDVLKKLTTRVISSEQIKEDF